MVKKSDEKNRFFAAILVVTLFAVSVIAIVYGQSTAQAIKVSGTYTCLSNDIGAQVYDPNYQLSYANNNKCKSTTILTKYTCSSATASNWFSSLFMTSSSSVTCQYGCANNVCLPPPSCVDNDGDGYGTGCTLGVDCNDNNVNINPAKAEVCDSVDNNCNSQVDEGVTNTCTDYATCTTFTSCNACLSAPSETCNGRDDNCNNQIDEGCPYCGDGVCQSTESVSSCPQDCQVTLPAGKVGAGDYNLSMQYGAYMRKYYMHVPASYNPNSPMPMVLVYHGGGGSISASVRQTQFNTEADRSGFIVVYPQGVGNVTSSVWNAGKCCGYAKATNVNDVGFTSALIAMVAKNVTLDSKRVYATGHSNGALMATRVGCELSTKIAAVAANSGQDGQTSCNPSRKVPFMLVSGTGDPRVPYNGGLCGVTDNWTCVSAPSFAQTKATANGCTAAPTTTFSNNTASCITYGSCAAPVIFCTINNGGHTWPGGKYESDTNYWKTQMGVLSPDMSDTQEMWKFFSEYSLP